MARKTNGISIEGAVALYLQTRPVPCTAKQCLQELLIEVRVLTGNFALTIKQIKDKLKKWFAEGWAIISNQSLQVTRAGRKQVKELAAEAALASSPLAAA